MRMLRVLPACLLAFALVASATGCAHESVADRHAKELREGLASVQAETDRTSGALDDRDASASIASARAKTGDGGVKPPITRTIRLGGGDEGGEDDDPNAVSPTRPKIEVQGPPSVAQRPPRALAPRRDTRIEMLGPAPEGDPSEPPPTKVEAAPADDAAPKAEPPKKSTRSRDRARPPEPKLSKDPR